MAEAIKNTLDNNMYECGTSIDIQKAFDTVSHYILIDNHKHYSVRIMTNGPFDSPSKSLLSNLRLKSIRELIDYKVAVMTYKSLNDLIPLYLKTICLLAALTALRELLEALKLILNCL